MSESTEVMTVEQKIAKVKSDISLAESMVETVLEKGIDWGLHPGTDSYALKDPGASKLINAFNCYSKAEVLYREVTDSKISYVFEVSLIYREDGKIKTSGCGACTTMETKYGYRWVADPESYGYDREGLKKRQGKAGIVYRIPNPEWSELENTILKMARKRAEVDSVMSLPGVGTALARMYAQAGGKAKADRPGDEWSGFWSRVKAMGLDQEKVHIALSVGSMKEWLAQGHTLNDAIKVLADMLAAQPKEF